MRRLSPPREADADIKRATLFSSYSGLRGSPCTSFHYSLFSVTRAELPFAPSRLESRLPGSLGTFNFFACTSLVTSPSSFNQITIPPLILRFCDFYQHQNIASLRLIFSPWKKRHHFGQHFEKAGKKRQSCWCLWSFIALCFLEPRNDSLTISGGEI